MKKNKLLFITLALLLSGCGNEKTNYQPTIEGVNAIECIVNSTVDLLSGVVCYDKEDGDITPDVDIEIYPEVKVNNGYAIFTEPGNYKITYTITDSNNQTTIKKTDINVVDRENYIDFSHVNGFYVTSSSNTKLLKGGMNNNSFLIQAENCQVFEDLCLNRVYDLIKDQEYTFKYYLNSQNAGDVRVNVDGYVLEQLSLNVGENTLVFKYRPNQSKSVTISLLLGGLGESVNCQFIKAESETLQQGGLTELVNDYEIISRLDKDGHDYSFEEPSINCSKSGNSSTLEVINPYVSSDEGNNIWRLGMFINTNIYLEEGKEYIVSFNVERENVNECEVSLQNNQFDERKFHTCYVNNQETLNQYQISIIPTSENVGRLWLYIQSGNASNTITISNLSVKTELDPIKVETFNLTDFVNYNDGYNCSLETFEGGFKYYIESFADVDYMQKVVSPTFKINESGNNFVITFKAKASKNIELVFASPVADGWDPTWVWSKITLSQEESIYSFVGGNQVGENGNQFVWQFGSTSNMKYSNVEIEISDIKISYKNREYDGE